MDPITLFAVLGFAINTLSEIDRCETGNKPDVEMTTYVHTHHFNSGYEYVDAHPGFGIDDGNHMIYYTPENSYGTPSLYATKKVKQYDNGVEVNLGIATGYQDHLANGAPIMPFISVTKDVQLTNADGVGIELTVGVIPGAIIATPKLKLCK